MTQSVRILILEDSPVDAELVQYELQEAGIAFSSKVVMTEKDFVHELQEYCPDIILSDYDLPNYDGALALAEVRRRCPDTPFILVTGAVGEDRAIEILTQGAKDYVLKSRLQRLAPAVQRALAEVEEHRARKAAEEELLESHRILEKALEESSAELRQSVARYRSLFDNMLNGFAYCRMLFDQERPQDFIYLDVNSAFETLTGLKNVVGKKVSDVIPGIRESDPELFESYGRVALTGKPEKLEKYVEAMQMWFSISVFSPEKEHFVALFDVITERKLLEETQSFLLQHAYSNEDFFASLARYLAQNLGMDYVCIDRLLGDRLTAQTVAIYFDGKFEDNVEYTLKDTPCGDAVGKAICCFPKNVRHLFPQDVILQEMVAESYVGTTLWSSKGQAIGLIAVLSRTPLSNPLLAETILKLVAIRAAGGLEHMLMEEERRRIETTLKNSEIRYRRLFEAAQDGILIIDAEKGQIADINPFLMEMLDYSKEDIVGKKLWEIGAFKDIEKSKIAFAELQNKRYARYDDLQLKAKNGSLIDVEFVSNVYLVDHIKVIQCNIRDITERKRTEGELTHLASFPMLNPNPVAEVDLEGRIHFLNPAIQQIFPDIAQRKLDHPFFTDWQELKHSLVSGGLQERTRELIISGRWYQQTFYFIEKSKIIRIYSLDITNRKEAEGLLIERAKQLENTNKELESFSYSISHDLRAPLRAINGFSRMLARDLKDRLDEESMHRLDTIRKNGLKMNHLIDAVLAFSRLGQESLTMTVIDMADLAADVWNELQENNPQQNVSINIVHPMPCYGDHQMLRRVITNLLSNAVKFTKERQTATIEVGSYEEEHECVYYVKDNGSGFDMQYSAKLFRLFQRLHSDTDYEGTGAGLSIVKRIVERHGGRVWAEGKVDEGATFYFTLPK